MDIPVQPVIPEPISFDPSLYPSQKEYGVYSNIGLPTKECPILKGCLLDLPKAERRKHMWHVPKELHDHEMYNLEPEHYKKDHCKVKRDEDEAKEKKQKKDQENTIASQAAAIQLLTNTMADLIKQVNILTSKK